MRWSFFLNTVDFPFLFLGHSFFSQQWLQMETALDTKLLLSYRLSQTDEVTRVKLISLSIRRDNVNN